MLFVYCCRLLVVAVGWCLLRVGCCCVLLFGVVCSLVCSFVVVVDVCCQLGVRC